jgi:hypothetical protein
MSRSAAACAERKRGPTKAHGKRVTADYLAWNASRPDPWPLCPTCGLPMDSMESEPLYPTLCGCCGFDRLYRIIEAITSTWGPEAARIKLRALADNPADPK